MKGFHTRRRLRAQNGSLRTPLILGGVVILVAVLGSFVPGPWPAAAWPTPGSNVGIAVGPDAAQSPSLEVDSTGTLHAFWSENVGTPRAVYHAQSADGTAWSPPAQIGTFSSDGYYPSSAIEREPVPLKDRLYVAYQAGSGSFSDAMFTASDDGGASWSAHRAIDTTLPGVPAILPDVAASQGRLYAAWSDTRNSTYHIFFRGSLDGGATWGPEVQLSSTELFALDARIEAKGGVVVVVWYASLASGTAIAMARSEDAGTTWTQTFAVRAPTASHIVLSPDIFLDDALITHLVWAQTEPTGESHVRYASSADGVTWSTPVVVDDMTVIATARTPSIDGVCGTLWVAWDDTRNGDPDVFVSWSSDGSKWADGVRDNDDLRIDDTDRNGIPGDDATTQQNPVLKTGGYGVSVAWEDLRAGNSDIYFAEVAMPTLAITEIQDTPASETRVELYNFGRAPFDPTGVSLVAGSSTIDLSPLVAIPGRSHVVVGAHPASDLRVALDLGSEGALIELRNATDVLDRVGTGLYGIAPDPLPGESSARFAGSTDYTSAWTRGLTPTFGLRNTVVAPDGRPLVVLNEVLYNPSQPGEQFVEIYYRGASTLDMTGYRLVADGVYTFPGASLSSAFPFGFLMQSGAPSWFGDLSATGDNVYLYDSAGRLLDMVGWSWAHTSGRSLNRAADGVGGRTAFDDPSAIANGWLFDRMPTLALLSLGPNAHVLTDIGTVVQFPLQATNLQSVGEYLNVGASATLPNWPVRFRWTNGTLITDSPGDPDSLPDLGSVAAHAVIPFLAEVAVPMEGPLGNGNVIIAEVSAASMPTARATANLTIDLLPHFDVSRAVDPSSVYLEGSGPPYNEIAQITLTVEGAGFPVVSTVPQDVVFQIDDSGSMNNNDAMNLRVDAVKTYISGMAPEDRASVIGFNTAAWVVNNRPLRFTDAVGKALLSMDADTLACSPGCIGGTSIDAALAAGNNWLITYGDPSRPRVEILLTDGVCEPPCTNTANLVNQAVAAGIVIYTIGLGSGVNPTFLRGISNPTGGSYYFAATAQDLEEIYLEIGTRVNRTAGIDPDVTDGTPMVEEVLAPYLNLVPGSFYDPNTGGARLPEFMMTLPDRTILQWNVSRIQINETWSVRYSVTSPVAGVLDVARYPDARVAYLRWDGSTVYQPIPQGTLEVLVVPTPPYLTWTDPPDGATGVPLDTPIRVRFSEGMDAPTVRWSISPVVALTASWPSADNLVLDHTGFAECTRYTVEVTEGLDLAGEALTAGPVPNPWSFTTLCPKTVVYTITRNPEQGEVFVDGANYAVPAILVWRPGEEHRLEALEFDPVGGSRLAFLSWDDGGARDHNITVGEENTTIVAEYALQHPATLTLAGLRADHPASVAYVLWDNASTAPSAGAWSSWVDDGSALGVDTLVQGIVGERWITEDVTGWIVTAPLAATVTYFHQFAVNIRLLGLEGHEVDVDRIEFGRPVHVEEDDLWSGWSDADRPVSVQDLVSVWARERFKTLGATQWSVSAPLDVTVAYLHQYRPRVVLEGTDVNHTVSVRGAVEASSFLNGDLFGEWFGWADAGSQLSFDNRTTGDPPREALDPFSFAVLSAFNATIRYAAPEPPPPPGKPPEANWKPILALVYAIVIVIAGVAFGTRPFDRYVPRENKERAKMLAALPLREKLDFMTLSEIEEKVRRDRRFSRLVLGLPLAGVEAAIGLFSYWTGIFRVPEMGNWLPVGFWANTIILAAGLAVGLVAWQRGYRMSEDDLLALAEAREGPAHAPGEAGEGTGARGGKETAAKGRASAPARDRTS